MFSSHICPPPFTLDLVKCHLWLHLILLSGLTSWNNVGGDWKILFSIAQCLMTNFVSHFFCVFLLSSVQVAKLIRELDQRLQGFNISQPRDNSRNKSEADQMEDMLVLKVRCPQRRRQLFVSTDCDRCWFHHNLCVSPNCCSFLCLNSCACATLNGHSFSLDVFSHSSELFKPIKAYTRKFGL